MIQKRLQLIVRQTTLSLTSLTIIVSSLVAGPASRATGAPSSPSTAASSADLSGVGCQLTMIFSVPQTGNVHIYSFAAVALSVAPTIELLDASNTVLYSSTGLATPSCPTQVPQPV